ncbi:MAG: hypothetical protein WD023_00355 [Ilumatobacteraceae bacterium]
MAPERSMLLLAVAGVVLGAAFAVTHACNVLVLGDGGSDATTALVRDGAARRTVTAVWLGTTLPLLAAAVVLVILSRRARRR